MRLSNFRKRALCASRAFAITAFIFAGACTFAETTDGFVTKIGSPADFYMSSLHVVMDGKAQCATETLGSDITWTWGRGAHVFSDVQVFALVNSLEKKSRKAVPCASVPLAIGSRVQIAGDAAGPDGAFLAAQVILYTVKIEHVLFAPDSMVREWEGGALLEEPPQVSRTEKGWTGTMWLNGYPMAITPGTKLLTAPIGTQLSYRPPGSQVKHPRVAEALKAPALKASRWDAVMPAGPVPSFTASLFQTNTWTVYQGGAPLNGQVPLESIRLWPNEFGEDEKNYLAGLTPVVHDPDYAGHVPGSFGFPGEGRPNSVEILADENIQRYVTALGSSLIPEYQKALLEEDKTKVDFRFYVVQGEQPLQDDEMETVDGVGAWSQKRLEAGAVAFPNGIILLPDGMLAKIGNEAQLAAILSDLITTVLQKQGYIGRRAWSDSGLWEDLIDQGQQNNPSIILPLFRSEQTLRIGIRQMYLAGYDIREAPIAWAAAAGKPTNPFLKTKKNPSVIPWYTTYAFDYISRFYSDVDYSKLKSGEKEYARFLDELRMADPDAFLEKK